MKQGREYSDYLEDILDAIQKAVNFIGEMPFKAFSEDDKTVFAVIRALEIIGEASKNIPEWFKTNLSFPCPKNLNWMVVMMMQ